jgi:hypothetical protein
MTTRDISRHQEAESTEAKRAPAPRSDVEFEILLSQRIIFFKSRSGTNTTIKVDKILFHSVNIRVQFYALF